MNWLFFALMAPLIWSFANYVDKYIISSVQSKDGGSEGFIVVSSFLSLIFSAILFVSQIGRINTEPNFLTILILILSGFFETIYIYFYFRSLEIESASTVIAFFQFAPVFGVILGAIFLKEYPSILQIIAMGIILIGTLFIVAKKDVSIFKNKIVGLMTLSTLFVGIFSLLFKIGSDGINFWDATKWQYFGMGITAFVFLLFSKKARTQFKSMSNNRIVMFSSIGEILNIGAILVLNKAITMAQVGIVLSISSIQPAFVFLEGIILAIISPKLFNAEKTKFKFLYIIGLILVIIGGFLIY